jgi:hypothetical protein
MDVSKPTNCRLGLNFSVTKMQEENKVVPAASSHTEIQSRPTFCRLARDKLGLKNRANVDIALFARDRGVATSSVQFRPCLSADDQLDFRILFRSL